MDVETITRQNDVMRSFYIVLALLTLIFVTCQHGVARAIRRYVFARQQRLRIRDGALIFLVLLCANILLAFLSMNSSWAVPDSQAQKILAVTFFTYLGVTLALGIFLVILKTLYFSLSLVLAGYRLLLILVSGDLGDIPVTGKRETDGRQVSCAGSSPDSGLLSVPDCATPVFPVLRRSMGAFALGCLRSGIRPLVSEQSIRRIAVAVILLFVAGGIYGVIEAYSQPKTENFEIRDAKLRGLAKPITLIHVTDIHYGMFYNQSDLQRLVENVNSIEADAVIFTGDIFHSPQTNVESAPAIFRKLRERRFGNLAVMGNHDFYAGEKRTVKAMEEGGLTLLRDEWLTIESGTGRIHIAGLDDPRKNWLSGQEFPNFPRMMENAPKDGGFRILLSHRPTVFPLASGSGFDLTLAGHTHGGQVIVPWGTSEKGWSPASVASIYTYGWYVQGRHRMYLNRGAGLTFIPWRINCSPEISVFTLMPS